MVSEIAIHLEGGGQTSETLAPFRRGMSAFLKPVVDEARRRRIRWRVIPCGGRRAAFDSFCDALANEPEVFNVLLVDAEEVVTQSPWGHLKSRVGDQWDKPEWATDDQCHLMIVMMETWFLADPDSVKEFFKLKKGFDADALPVLPPPPAPPKLPTALEAMSKERVNEALRKATKDTKDGQYEKIRHGVKLLAAVKPERVREQCPSCDRLFKTLGKAIGTTL
jgi:hypothetical protein